MINPISCTSSGINTESNVITIENHGLLTGNKIYYTSDDPIEGLSSKENYYVFKVDDNSFNLAETIPDIFDPVRVAEFSTVWGTHEFSLVNPQIRVVRNNNLVFGVGHSSLEGYVF